MSQIEINQKTHDFLNRKPGLLAVIGTNGHEGHPLLVPVWYRWDGKAILVWSLESRAWIQNALRDPKVGVSVQEESAPPMAVIMRGAATVETSDGSHIDDEIRRISQRYVPEESISGYLRDWPELRTIVRIVPQRIFVWGSNCDSRT